MVRLAAIALVIALGGCSPGAGSPGGAGPPPNGPFVLHGTAQNFPFWAASTARVQPLDASGVASGMALEARTADVLGAFEVTIDAPVLAEITISRETPLSYGAYAPKLRAIAQLTGPDQVVRANVVTHLAALRARTLLESGVPPAEAIDRAEKDVWRVLGLSATAQAANAIDILAADDASAALLAAGCIIGYAAAPTYWSNGEARTGFTNVVDPWEALADRVAGELALDGEVDAATAEVLGASRARLDLQGRGPCAAYAKDYVEYVRGPAAPAPDPGRVLDLDRDGTPDAHDADVDGDGLAGDADALLFASGTWEPGATSRATGFKGTAVDAAGVVWKWDAWGVPWPAARVDAPPIAMAEITPGYEAVLTESGTLDLGWGAPRTGAVRLYCDGTSLLGTGELLYWSFDIPARTPPVSERETHAIAKTDAYVGSLEDGWYHSAVTVYDDGTLSVRSTANDGSGLTRELSPALTDVVDAVPLAGASLGDPAALVLRGDATAWRVDDTAASRVGSLDGIVQIRLWSISRFTPATYVALRSDGTLWMMEASMLRRPPSTALEWSEWPVLSGVTGVDCGAETFIVGRRYAVVMDRTFTQARWVDIPR